MQESFWWWKCSDRYIISLSPHLHTPPLPAPNKPYGFCGRWAPYLLTVSLSLSRFLYKVPGEIKRSRDLEEGGGRSWTFKLAQKRSWVGRWSWAAKVGLLSLRVVLQQQCNAHCPCHWLCPSTAVETAVAQSALVAQWRGDTALTLPLFWRRSTVSPVFVGRYPRSSLHSFVLSPPVTNKSSPSFCGRKAKCTRFLYLLFNSIWH